MFEALSVLEALFISSRLVLTPSGTFLFLPPPLTGGLLTETGGLIEYGVDTGGLLTDEEGFLPVEEG